MCYLFASAKLQRFPVFFNVPWHFSISMRQIEENDSWPVKSMRVPARARTEVRWSKACQVQNLRKHSLSPAGSRSYLTES